MARTIGYVRAVISRRAAVLGREVAPTGRVVLTSYATAEWYTSLLRLQSSAVRHGFTDLQTWQRKDLVKTPFYKEHRATLDEPRGGGFWLWKAYIILHALEQAAPGDAVVYVDSGVAFVDDVDPLIVLCQREGGVLLFAGHYEGSVRLARTSTVAGPSATASSA